MTRRVTHLVWAGAIDSVGLAFGWTVFNLVAVSRHGLAVTALLNVAMFCGVALSAPAASRLTRWLNGSRVLQATAGAEALLRVGSLALLCSGAPLPLVFASVLAMNVFGWVGFAGMRGEISAAGAGAVGMTRYLAVTVALEALGASLGALLPISRYGGVAASWLGVAFLGYALSLLPTVVVASGSTVPVRASNARRSQDPHRRRLLFAGAALMAIGSGPTLLFVALSARLHGNRSVVGASIAFAVGALLAPTIIRRLAPGAQATVRSWPLWCAGMVVGWALAPWSLEGLWAAQLLSGVCLTGFQGSMDHALVRTEVGDCATTSLAEGAAARAVGSAAAVRLVPAFSAAGPLAAFAGVTAVIGLGLGSLLARYVDRDEPSVTISTHPAELVH